MIRAIVRTSAAVRLVDVEAARALAKDKEEGTILSLRSLRRASPLSSGKSEAASQTPPRRPQSTKFRSTLFGRRRKKVSPATRKRGRESHFGLRRQDDPTTTTKKKKKALFFSRPSRKGRATRPFLANDSDNVGAHLLLVLRRRQAFQTSTDLRASEAEGKEGREGKRLSKNMEWAAMGLRARCAFSVVPFAVSARHFCSLLREGRELFLRPSTSTSPPPASRRRRGSKCAMGKRR